jgi:hypothetical protein
VTWGEQSSEEMLALYMHYRWVGETVKDQRNDYDALMQQGLMIGVLDDNMDGKLSPDELRGTQGQPLKANFALVDQNKDGFIENSELQAALKVLGARRRQAAPADAPKPAAEAAPAPGAKPAVAKN